MSQPVKNPPAMRETWVQSLGREHPLEKAKADQVSASQPALFLASLICDVSGAPWASLVAQLVKNLPAMWEIWVRSLGWEDPL